MENLLCNVLMLPTHELKGALFIESTEGKLIPNFYTDKHIFWKDCKYQHLYFTSNREIKQGEYFLFNGIIEKAEEMLILNIKCESGYTLDINECKKIEATTHPSLNVPFIHKDYVTWYAEKSNDSGVPIDFSIIKITEQWSGKDSEPTYHVETNADNTVIVENFNQ